MRSIILCITILIFSIPCFAGEQVILFDGRLSFELPDGFSTMPKDIAKIKYPMETHRPKYIYSNSKASTSIAVNLTENSSLQSQQLAEFKTFMEQTLVRMTPGLKWVKKEIITLNGTEWARLEFMSNAIDTDIHNIMLMTSFQGKPLMLNFNSTKEEFASVEKGLSDSIRSIKIGS
jgi:hypothetical protein